MADKVGITYQGEPLSQPRPAHLSHHTRTRTCQSLRLGSTQTTDVHIPRRFPRTRSISKHSFIHLSFPLPFFWSLSLSPFYFSHIFHSSSFSKSYPSSSVPFIVLFSLLHPLYIYPSLTHIPSSTPCLTVPSFSHRSTIVILSSPSSYLSFISSFWSSPLQVMCSEVFTETCPCDKLKYNPCVYSSKINLLRHVRSTNESNKAIGMYF